ncbi:hypothetical protein [Streptomyces sp. NPDC001315]|uniref:hypothetical protein n=1 Tax=Streptomyces sp. NPDC001315 TaxID=3364562 RepID=UPI0036B5E076
MHTPHGADAVVVGLHGTDMSRALATYERRRLDGARSLVRSGQQFSRSFTARGA